MAEQLLLLLRRWRAAGGGELLLGASWDAVRAEAVAPALAAASGVCLAFSALLLAEAVFMAAASLAWRRPERRYRADPLGAHDEGEEEDEESGLLGYPMVLVQIPMYNEREVRILCVYKFKRKVHVYVCTVGIRIR
jgi:beta-mannan synthase